MASFCLDMKKVIIILGGTASGKSGIAFRLAQAFNGFLISADSRQLYQGMDIGTNKDKGIWQKVKEEKVYLVGWIKEFLVDIIKPDQEFNLDDWLKETKQIIRDELGLPIIVGGTGLYISALVDDFQLPGNFNLALRSELEKRVARDGLSGLIAEVKKIDPEIEQKIDLKNPRRVVRAAEICLQTAQPLARKKGQADFEFLQIGIDVSREILYKKINKRVEQMMDAGLVEEVETLINCGYAKNLPSMTGIGYRQIVQFLNKEITRENAIELIKRDTRRYAKRQMTWFKRDKRILWLKDYTEIEKVVQKFVNQ